VFSFRERFVDATLVGGATDGSKLYYLGFVGRWVRRKLMAAHNR